MKDKRRILITGCNGFVGQHLVRELESEFSLVRLSYKGQKGEISFDLRNKPAEALKQKIGSVDEAIHLAAFMLKSKEDNTLEQSEKFYSANVFGTLNFLKLIQDKEISHLTYISTVDVYGKNISKGIVTEETEVAPETYYAASKLAGEQLCQVFCQERKIPLAILRLGHIYGPGESDFKKAIPEFIRRAIKGEDIEIYGSGSAARTFIYVGDVARVISLVSSKKIAGIYNVVGENSISIAELAKLVNKLEGERSKIVFSHDNFPQQNYVFDNKKLAQIGISGKTKLEDGLRIEINTMKGIE